MPLDGGQTRSGTPTEKSVNPKRQPGSRSIGSGVEGTGDNRVSTNTRSMPSTNRTNRVRPEVSGQDERGYVQTDAGNVQTTITSANRSRKIPSP